MRGSTAAGINISLLPRDCSCGEFACSAVWGKASCLWHLCEFACSAVWGRGLVFGVCWISGSAVWERDLFPGICGEFAVGAILEEASFPWHFWHLAFVAFGICGIWRLWHLAFLAFGSFGTGEGLLWYGICTRCAEQPPVVRDAFSGALGVKNRLFWYRSDIRYRKPPSLVRSRYSCAQNRLLWYAEHSGAPDANLSHLNQENTAAVNTSLFSCRFMDVPI